MIDFVPGVKQGMWLFYNVKMTVVSATFTWNLDTPPAGTGMTVLQIGQENVRINFLSSLPSSLLLASKVICLQRKYNLGNFNSANEYYFMNILSCNGEFIYEPQLLENRIRLVLSRFKIRVFKCINATVIFITGSRSKVRQSKKLFIKYIYT